MNIRKEQIDALNAIIKINIDEFDYAEKVKKIVDNQRKNANIKGFRKGAVPESLIQKQFGKPALIQEVNTLLQTSLNDYLKKEKLDILGNPMPKINENFSWDDKNFSFEFEIALAPDFSVDLKRANNITQYTIIADEALINEQVTRIQKQYGKFITEPTVAANFDVKGTFVNQENNINNQVTINETVFNDKNTFAALIGKQVGDVVAFETKGLFADDHQLMDYLKVDHDNVHGLDITVNFTIDGITSTEKAELNKELFDKLFPQGDVNTVEGLKQKIKEDAEMQFVQQADQKYLNDVTEFLVESTNFELPATFLKKWIQTIGETPLTAEQAEAEYEKSEKGLRYQLIETKVIIENNLQIQYEELTAFTSQLIQAQMAQFGQLNPTEEELNNIVTRVLSNQEEIKRVSDQLMSTKMLNLYKENVSATQKEIIYPDFIKAMYGEN
jgi:trigger factor